MKVSENLPRNLLALGIYSVVFTILLSLLFHFSFRTTIIGIILGIFSGILNSIYAELCKLNNKGNGQCADCGCKTPNTGREEMKDEKGKVLLKG